MTQADFAAETLAGFVRAFPALVQQVPGGVVRAAAPTPGKVAVVIGGGSGHYPAFAGWVGPGLADGAVVGRRVRVAVGSSGGLCRDGCPGRRRGAADATATMPVTCSTSGRARGTDRRRGSDALSRGHRRPGFGAAGRADAASRNGGRSFRHQSGGRGGRSRLRPRRGGAPRGQGQQVDVLAQRCLHRVHAARIRRHRCFRCPRVRWVLVLACTASPASPRSRCSAAAELADLLVERVLAERPESARRAVVLVNGMGSTRYEELFVLWNEIAPRLERQGVEVVEPEVGELITSLDMAGVSLTVSWLDDELEAMWGAPAPLRPTIRSRSSLGAAVNAARSKPRIARVGPAGQRRLTGHREAYSRCAGVHRRLAGRTRDRTRRA